MSEKYISARGFWKRKIIVQVWNMYVYGMALMDIAAATDLTLPDVEDILDLILC